jgi:ammonium transporter, Amt family
MQLRARSRVVDALDVFACHGVAGVLGALLTGVFATKAVNPAGADGLLAGNPGQLGVQLVAVGATVTLAGAATALILTAVRALAGLRVPIVDEIGGIDISEHGEAAYHGGGPGELAGSNGSIGESVLIATEVRQPVRGVA